MGSLGAEENEMGSGMDEEGGLGSFGVEEDEMGSGRDEEGEVWFGEDIAVFNLT